jgi:hypothetical protein
VASEAEVRFWLKVSLGGIATSVSGLVWVGAAATIVAGAAARRAAALGAAAFLAAFFAFAAFAMADLAVMMKVRKMHNHDWIMERLLPASKSSVSSTTNAT